MTCLPLAAAPASDALQGGQHQIQVEATAVQAKTAPTRKLRDCQAAGNWEQGEEQEDQEVLNHNQLEEL